MTNEAELNELRERIGRLRISEQLHLFELLLVRLSPQVRRGAGYRSCRTGRPAGAGIKPRGAETCGEGK
ncbi:hypothetical protein GobsT_05780 [Gemmata obscuriglobus]|nr:hypothetical protein GobsT_05780 [Gemmata obscuriglobus]VTR99807.1 unnamed protein product [Gemmata obscuriglobus UQM 2246]